MAPLTDVNGYIFILGGQEGQHEVTGNLRCIAKQSVFYHPDLVAASDLVVGKAGYSTLAEVYAAGVPFAYISREAFPESAVLADFIFRKMKGTELPEVDLQNGRWLGQLDKLTNQKTGVGSRENGAVAVARYIADVLSLR